MSGLIEYYEPDIGPRSSANESVTGNDSFFLFGNCTWNETLGKFIEDGCKIPENSLWITILLFILYGMVCIVGLCGNSLVIYVVLRYSKMQTVTNLYIVNLAIADECFLVGVPFLMITMVVEYWPFGDIMCKIYFITTSINQVTSSMFLLIMSADRFLAVCHPISSTRYRTQLIASVVALTAWTLSAIIMAPIFMYTNTSTVGNRVSCNIYWPEGWMRGDQTFMLYSFLLGFLIPISLISVFYILVILRLQNLGPKDKNQGNNGNKDGPSELNANQQNRAKIRRKSHRKVTKLVLTVITVYFICWVPYWIMQLMLIFLPSNTLHSQFRTTAFLLAGCLSYSNSAMNPILYAFLSDNFKKSFLKACRCVTGKDMNKILHNEPSVFPKPKKGEPTKEGKSESNRGLVPTAVITSGNSSVRTVTKNAGGQDLNNTINNSKINPQDYNLLEDDDGGFFDSDEEGAANIGIKKNHETTGLKTRTNPNQNGSSQELFSVTAL